MLINKFKQEKCKFFTLILLLIKIIDLNYVTNEIK